MPFAPPRWMIARVTKNAAPWTAAAVRIFPHGASSTLARGGSSSSTRLHRRLAIFFET